MSQERQMREMCTRANVDAVLNCIGLTNLSDLMIERKNLVQTNILLRFSLNFSIHFSIHNKIYLNKLIYYLYVTLCYEEVKPCVQINYVNQL